MKEGVLFSGGMKVEENREDIKEVGNGGNECTIKSGIIRGGWERFLPTLFCPTVFEIFNIGGRNYWWWKLIPVFLIHNQQNVHILNAFISLAQTHRHCNCCCCCC